MSGSLMASRRPDFQTLFESVPGLCGAAGSETAKVDGLEVLRQMKADPRAGVNPVGVLTSSREEPDISESYRLGVNSYIVKPADFTRFTDAVRTLGLYWVLLDNPSIA